MGTITYIIITKEQKQYSSLDYDNYTDHNSYSGNVSYETFEYEEVEYFDNEDKFKKKLEQLFNDRKQFKAFSVKPLDVKQTINISY